MEKKKLTKSNIYMIACIFILLLAVAGSAYAYYSASATGEIVGEAAGAGLNLTIEKLSNTNGDLIPLDNTPDMLTKAAKGYGNSTNTFNASKSCIDKNGYTVCQVYKITLSNTSTVPLVLNGGVTLYGGNTPNIECSKMASSTSVTDNTSCKGPKTLADNYTLNAGSSNEYYIIVYINNLNEEQEDAGEFNGIITFTSTQGAKIYAKFKDDPALDTLINLGLSVDTQHTPDFTTVSGNSGIKIDMNTGNELATGLGDQTNGIYEAEDDLGTSYYFRGDVQNNHVYFANNWWRIVRINGDGTIRIITEENVGKSEYNTNNNDNAYVGYMYGTPGATSYNATHSNANNSTIKTYIDNWYQESLSSYSQYIADAIYCNDREVVNASLSNGNETITFSGNGSGVQNSAYAGMKRTYIDHTPTLKCTNTNDRFTVNSSIGNGALTYPIGLITADEVVMAGGSDLSYVSLSYIFNENYYLYVNDAYWTMTPSTFEQYSAFVYVEFSATLSYVPVGNGPAAQQSVARPVISLKPNVITGGTGTSDDPFYVVDKPTS